jgi:farnesyl-diphosphate farnesyltransferase
MSTRLADAAAGDVESWSGKDRADENFPVGSILIRRDLRRHVHAFYAFARNADDIADSAALSPAEKLVRLDVMEAVLLGERPDGSSSATALHRSLAETGVNARHARDLLRAFRQDATQQRYESWAALLEYCRYSAMPVGRHVLDLHGEDAATHPSSDALCSALQVLNHLQDCASDLRDLDRCYLPLDWLAAAGTDVAALRAPAAAPALRLVFDRLLDEVDRLHDSARTLPYRTAARGLRMETAAIVGLSRRLARRLRRGDPVAARIRLYRRDVLASVLAALRFLP